MLRVFLQQLVEHLPGLGAVAVEEVLARFAKPLRPFATGVQRRVEGQVAQQVERIRVGLLGNLG